MIEAFWGGEEGGAALAEAIFGDFCPAGRLPYTVYASEDQVPPQDEYDISHGFTYMYIKGDPLYAFGHGLSYTDFSYGAFSATPATITSAGRLTVSVEVENTGGRSGDEVVQLYVRAVDSHVPRPRLQLRGFRRVTLAPREKMRVEFALAAEDLAYYDVTRHGFLVEPGEYEVLIGGSSQDIRARARFHVAN